MTLGTLSETSVRQEARRNPLTQFLWLVGVNLYLARRRIMSKVLLGILLGLFALIVGFYTLAYVSVQSTPTQTDCPPRDQGGCFTPEVQARALDGIRSLFTFPTSLGFIGGYTTFVGVIVICVMAGTVVGSEYGFGTHRLSLSRGLSRAQVLGGQVLAAAALSLITVAFMLGVGALLGVTLGPALGATVQGVSGEGVREIVFYWLAISLNLFAYALVALFFATLGRSTAAGIGAGIGLVFLEYVAQGILAIVFASNPSLASGDIGKWLQQLPDWFLRTNVSDLVAHASEAPIAFNSAPGLDLTHAALVAAAYCVVLVGGSYALFRSRDMTD